PVAVLDPSLVPAAVAPPVPEPPAPAIVADAPHARAATPELAPTPAPPRATPAELAKLLGVAQAQLAAGKLVDALATVKLAEARGELGAEWWLVAGDASRGLGH